MPPPLAACLCAGFITWLLYRDSKRSQKTSSSLWIPILWVAIIASKPVVYWMQTSRSEADANSYLDGNPVDRNVFLALMIAAGMALALRRLDWVSIIKKNSWVWLFYAYLAISVIWSDHPAVAFRRWVKDVGNVLMILIMLTETNPMEAVRRVFLRCGYVLVPLSILTIKYYPDIGRYYHRWTYSTCYCGVTTNKNSLGVLAMVTGIFLAWDILRAKEGKTWRGVSKRMWPECVVLGTWDALACGYSP